MGDSFTGQKTQPTVSIQSTEGMDVTKLKLPRKRNNTKYSNTINRHTIP